MRSVKVRLASASPRRLAVLRMLGLDPRVVQPGPVERPHAAAESPASYAVAQARAKLGSAAVVAEGAVTIAADTVVVLDGRVFGKPSAPDEARAMLRDLSGRVHEVVTGVAVRYGPAEASGWERTRVAFRELGDDEIAAYVAGREPLDKAGAYGIQGAGAALVRAVEGCYFNVVGLPVVRLLELLAEVGLAYRFGGGIVPLEAAARLDPSGTSSYLT